VTLETQSETWGVNPIDWGAFWSQESPAEEWLIEPVVAAGRQTAIYSTAKTGKSLLSLDISAARSTGRSSLGQSAQDPIGVVYLDLEMTEADLRERLGDLGYGPHDDLSRLHYYSLPTLPSLDTDLGGEIVVDLARRAEAQLVVVDTMARVVSGDENSADTYRNFYRFTGSRLKQAGIALLRLDHQGKDPSQGARGSSAKDDDLDIVFRLSTVDATTLKLTRTRSRIPWVPSEVMVTRREEPFLRHVLSHDTFPAGTQELVRLLDELEVPDDASSAMAVQALKAAGHGKRKQLVLAALKVRKVRR
jgi:hypothetical protein